jgi:acyl-CoA reductase-like NAD-dependent aldehyde dehydrogenase
MRKSRAGTVWVNDPLTDNDAGPFGGFRQSCLGREGLEVPIRRVRGPEGSALVGLVFESRNAMLDFF